MIPENGNRVRSVLVLELGGIGDVILSVPAIAALWKRFPGADVTVLTVPRTRTVLERLGESMRGDSGAGFRSLALASADVRAGLPASSRDLSTVLSLRRRRFDLLVDLSAIESRAADMKRMLVVKFIGARLSIGRGTCGRGRFFDAFAPEDLDSPLHEMERKLDVAFLLGSMSPLSAPIFPVSEREREEAARFMKSCGIGEGDLLAAMHPAGTGAHKRWPAGNFAVAGDWLTENLGARVVMIGGPGTRGLLEEVSRQAHCRRLIAASSLSLGVAAAILERASLFLTNDSGPMHMAAALGVPTVAVFGQTNHARYLPLLPCSRRELAFADPRRCSRGWKGGPREECRRSTCARPECLTAVSAEEVIGKMEALCSRIGLLYSTYFAAGAAQAQQPECPGSPDAAALGPVEGGREDWGFMTRRARDLSARLLEGMEGPVLDVACGKGFLLDDLGGRTQAGERLWGVDISLAQLRKAKSLFLARSPGHAGRMRLVCGDMVSLPFRSGFFSACLCVNTLQNLEANGRLRASLGELSRITAPGGTVLLEVRNSRNPLVILRFLFGRFFRKIPLRVHRLGKVLDAARQSGLALRARESVGPGRGPLAYSFILILSKEGNPCTRKSPR
jgi:heptosyltransferase-2